MRAIVLGAREGSGNIGDETAKHLTHSLDMSVTAHDCFNPQEQKYEIPYLYEEFANAESLVVTLGRTSMTPFHLIGEEEIEAVVHGSLTLPLLAVREYVSCRLDQGGRIVLVGSYAHRHPFSTGTAYCAAKAGIDMAGRTLGWELTDRGYQIFVVHPYHVMGTPMWEEVQKGVMESKGMTRLEADDYALKDAKMELMTPTMVGDFIGMILNEPSMRFMSGSNFEMFGGTR